MPEQPSFDKWRANDPLEARKLNQPLEWIERNAVGGSVNQTPDIVSGDAAVGGVRRGHVHRVPPLSLSNVSISVFDEISSEIIEVGMPFFVWRGEAFAYWFANSQTMERTVVGTTDTVTLTLDPRYATGQNILFAPLLSPLTAPVDVPINYMDLNADARIMVVNHPTGLSLG